MKDPTSLEDYFGVQIVQSDDGKKAWLGQPRIIKSLEKQFGEKVAKKKMTVTPGTLGFIGGKVDDISKVDEKTQSMYRSGVGTLDRSQNYAFFCIYLHYISLALHLHFICILHSPQN